MRGIGAPLLLLVLLSGCPRRPLDFGTYGRIRDPQRILDAVQAQRRAVRSVQGDAKAYLTTSRGSGKLSQYLVAEAPDRIRIESLSFFGDPIAVLTSDGQRFALHEIKENKFYEGASTAANVSRLLPFDLEPDELVSLVLGVPPIASHPRIVGFELDTREGVYRLTLADGDDVELLSVGTEKLRPTRVDMAARPGLSAYRAEFDDYDDKQNLPTDVRLWAPDGKSSVELKWKSDREVNGEVDPTVFTQPPPAGVPRFELGLGGARSVAPFG